MMSPNDYENEIDKVCELGRDGKSRYKSGFVEVII